MSHCMNLHYLKHYLHHCCSPHCWLLCSVSALTGEVAVESIVQVDIDHSPNATHDRLVMGDFEGGSSSASTQGSLSWGGDDADCLRLVLISLCFFFFCPLHLLALAIPGVTLLESPYTKRITNFSKLLITFGGHGRCVPHDESNLCASLDFAKRPTIINLLAPKNPELWSHPLMTCTEMMDWDISSLHKRLASISWCLRYMLRIPGVLWATYAAWT